MVPFIKRNIQKLRFIFISVSFGDLTVTGPMDFKGYSKCPRNTKNFKTFYSKQGHSLDGRLETFYRLYKSPIFL